jgi:hypothetical protein
LPYTLGKFVRERLNPLLIVALDHNTDERFGPRRTYQQSSISG